jgi:hypothetical protein
VLTGGALLSLDRRAKARGGLLEARRVREDLSLGFAGDRPSR